MGRATSESREGNYRARRRGGDYRDENRDMETATDLVYVLKYPAKDRDDADIGPAVSRPIFAAATAILKNYKRRASKDGA